MQSEKSEEIPRGIVRIEEFGKAEQLVDFFHRASFEPKSAKDSLRIGRNGFIFRGQANADWPLHPKAHRGDLPCGTELWLRAPNRTRGYVSNAVERTQFLALQMTEELRQVRDFLEGADAQGIQTPLQHALSRLHKNELVQRWLDPAEARSSSHFPDEPLHEAFALAQHYGVPTRFLDWSESPWIAAFFAAYGSLQREVKERPVPERFGVAILHAPPNSYADESSFPLRLVRARRADNAFLRSQQGVFTLDTLSNDFFVQHGRWPTLLESIERADWSATNVSPPHPALSWVTLPTIEARALLRYLLGREITPWSIWPTLDQAARADEYRRLIFPS